MDVSTTRRALHGIAELVLAGAQWRASQTIRLRVVDGGFATVAAPDLSVVGNEVVSGELRLPIADVSPAGLAAALGVEAGELSALYHDGSGVALDDVLTADAEAAGYLALCFGAGERALRGFAPHETPTLWPEHFDLGISVGEVNYGVSPGDTHIDEPYAYVGPWQVPTGEFWNESFGASMPIGPAPDADAILAFFDAGRRAVG